MDATFNNAASEEASSRVLNLFESLDLSRKQLSEFPEKTLPAEESRHHVRKLDLHHNHIGFIPQTIESFTNLVELNVSNNGLSHVSEEISTLQCLQAFKAKNNCLDNDSLPKTFDQLHALQYVDLGGNSFTEFPPQLVHLPNMQILYLGSNKIRTLPSSVDSLQRLVMS